MGVVIVLIIIALISLSSYTNHGDQVTVPSVSNMSVSDAEKLLAKNDLSYEIVDSIFSRTMPPGHVSDQDPVPSSIVKKNRKIYLTINAKGVQLLPVPQVINMSLRQAQSLVEASDFTIRKIEYANSEYKDLVLEMKLQQKIVRAGENLPAGSALTLVVGNGFNGSLAKVPNIKALTYDKAMEIAGASGFNISDAIFDEVPLNASEERKYVVYRQEPRDNASLATGEFIKVWLTKTPQLYVEEEDEASLEEELLF